MARRSDVLTNLLLASAPLHGLKGTEKVAPHFSFCWHAALRGDAPERKAITLEIARGLLRDVLDICEAEGVERQDLVNDFNNYRDTAEGDPVEALSRRLLNLLDARATTAKGEQL